MRLVFPTNENMGYLSKRGAHFGKAKYYTIITLDNKEISDVEVIENTGHSGACSGAVTNIMALNPDALVVSGIGANPARGFQEAGLEVYYDGESKKVQDSIQMFIEGKLQKLASEGTCAHH